MKDQQIRIDYIEFQVLDMEKTKSFYREAFGWTFTDYGENYCEFQDGRLKGGFEKAETFNTGGPLIVMYSEHLEVVLDRVKALGMKIAKDIFSFPGGRRFQFVDPNGYELAVWSDK